MDEWKEGLTAKQLSALQQLKTNVADVTVTTKEDFFYFRYLKARRFDVKKAEQMLRASLDWRRSYGADTLLTNWTPPEVLDRYWPGGLYGNDKEGHPILWQLCRDFDAGTMMKCAKKSDIVKYHIWRMEKVMKACDDQTAKLGKRIYSAVNISDLDGFGLGMLFTPGIGETLKQAFAIYEANYPERLCTSYVINAPAVFPAIFNILKPFLREETKRKVHILGRDWRSEVFKSVDPSQIPAFWGGTATDPDERCSNHINHCNVPIPSSFLLTEKIQLNEETLSTITVARGDTYNLMYNIKEQGTIISWMFETDDHDIAFAAYKCGNMDNWKSKKYQTILESTRVDSHVAPDSGSLTCDGPGIYILQFDNTYSWVNPKTVRYEVEILDPDHDIIQQDDQLQMRHQIEAELIAQKDAVTYL